MMQKKSGNSRVLTRTGGLIVAAAVFGGLAACGQTSTAGSTVASADQSESTGAATSADQASVDDSSNTNADSDTGEAAADVSISGMTVDVHRDPG